MRQVDEKLFEGLKMALLDCIASNTTVNDLRIIPPKLDEERVENAAVIALMSLCCDWVRPKGVTFVCGDITNWRRLMPLSAISTSNGSTRKSRSGKSSSRRDKQF